jgi:cytochrome c2
VHFGGTSITQIYRNDCHDLFQQEAGVIQDLKNQGKLKTKQVMNKKCLKCHRAKKKAGEEAGPTK